MELLPVEVISHILTFLRNGDAISLALTGKHFYNAFHDPRVLKTQRLRFDNCSLDITQAPLSVFAKSSINYQSLILGASIRNIVLDKTSCHNFWIKFGYHIRELTIETPGNVAFQILSMYMPNLRVLKVHNRGTHPINFGKEDLARLKICLARVHTLEICANYEQLEELLDLLPRLENLSLEGFSCKQQRTFTRNSSLSLHFLTRYLTKIRAVELKSLLLHSYCVEVNSNEKFFYELASTTGLLLKTLACSIEGVPIPLLQKLFHNMENTLKRLDLTTWVMISSEIYKIIFVYLKNIEQLTFRGRLTLDGLDYISDLKNLKVLRFKDSFENVEVNENPSHFLKKLKASPGLKELQIDMKCLNSHECSSCFYYFISDPNISQSLQILNVSRSRIDDKNLSFLISYARNLKQLYMSDCKSVTKFEVAVVGIADVERTNEKIVLENGKMLSKLEILEISHCTNLKSIGLMNLFCLNQLRHLFLNNIEAITSPVVQLISDYCPSLEKISFANCPKLTDECIEFIIKLRRLKHLDISGCKKLTKLTEYALWKSHRLQALHAVGLEHLEISIIMIFTKINTLRLYRCDKDYTRVLFEAKKYGTKQKIENVRRCLVFTQTNRAKNLNVAKVKPNFLN